MSDLPKPPKVPCGSCPYLKSTPSGLWHKDEYHKLPLYDGEIIDQIMNGAMGLFMCHQQDGCLCGGWLMTHGVENLAALRLKAVDPSVADYAPDVPVWASGREACDHGLRDIEEPSRVAQRKIDGLERLQTKRAEK